MGKAIRLDKFLADAGSGTRSEVKKYIQKGKVQVNGITAKKPELKVSETDEVILDGTVVSKAPEFVYYLLHKPAGYVSATEDKCDRTVMELVPSDRKGLFPVGRLDKDTEGLLLITDDGALAHELLSPDARQMRMYSNLHRDLKLEKKIQLCPQNLNSSAQEKLKIQNWNNIRPAGFQKSSLLSKRVSSIRLNE